ncbi:hypothetical protein [Limnobacter sp.]|nr:hypothetical protein [Limnobacter sp.]
MGWVVAFELSFAGGVVGAIASAKLLDSTVIEYGDFLDLKD